MRVRMVLLASLVVGFASLALLGADGRDVGCDGGRPYPPPGAWPPNAGPGGPARTFAEADLYTNCAFIDGGFLDLFDHHNLVVMYDGYLLLPWAPEWGIGGLTFYDVSDPCDPRVVGEGTSFQMRETHSVGFSAMGGRWAVVDMIEPGLLTRNGGIQFWDVSDPRAPQAVSNFRLPGFLYPDAYARVTLSVFWQAPYVYAAAADNGVYIVDATDPRAPSLVGQYQFDPILRAGQVQAIGNLLVVTAAEGARTALLDISDPAAPKPIAGGDFLATDRFGTPREAYFTNTTGGYVYYARKEGGGGLMVWDIRDPSRPAFAGDVVTEGNGGYVFVHEGRAFVGESNFAAMYDLSDLGDIRTLARFDLEGDLDTITPIGNVAVLSVDDGADTDKGSAIAPFATEPDRTPPAVTWVWPPDKAAGQAVTSRIGATFGEFVDPKSAWEGSVRLYETAKAPALGRVDGFISVQETIVNFWPARPLEPGTSYTFEIPAGGVADLSGNAVAATFTSTFTTADAGVLVADAGPDGAAEVGETVAFDGSGSEGAALYQWDFGDGTTSGPPSPDSAASRAYAAPGRYRAVLTAFGPSGGTATDDRLVVVTEPVVHAPRQSSTLVAIPGTERFAVVSPDSDEVVLIERGPGDFFSAIRRMPTCDQPRTVAVWDDWLAVPCDDGDAVQLLGYGAATASWRLAMPYGSRPYGAVAQGEALYVSLQGTGELAEIRAVGHQAPRVVRRIPAIADARGIAALPDGRVAVSRWRSPDARAEIAFVDPATESVEIRTLAFDPQIASDTEIGGVPSYLDQILVAPNGRTVAIPSLQANIADGLFLNGRPQTFETVVRAVVSFLDLPAGAEDFDARKQFDNRGLASAAVWSPRGDYLYLAMRGSRTVERLDMLAGAAQSGTLLDVGLAPDGLAVSADGRFLLVHAFMSREVAVYDLAGFDALEPPVARLATASAEPLAPEVLRGKQLFNDSFDPRLGKDGYMACAHCHFDAVADNRTWDFTDRGEGLRNTISLRGRAGTGDGPVHWSANFDEIQDFENDIRGPFQGLGLMDDADFFAGTRVHPLGDAKAGVSADLDALAAYVASLASEPRSPYRNAAGSLTDAARRGKAIFESAQANCLTCHTGPRLTDSALMPPTLPPPHNVGTLGPGSGGRLGVVPLTGVDTPTLHGLWHSAPYLHDGSAPTVRDVVTVRNPADEHGVTSHLSEAEIDDLVAYLLSLDGRRD